VTSISLEKINSIQVQSDLALTSKPKDEKNNKHKKKKKTKMTDTDLMNNFMKSLHSHPDDDLPIV
jgi:hypothetical protein